ncbi:SecY-interacting protein [Vibrio metschnikovii]|uniref:SecY-interacting protein n=1 Tax=bacterium 19MO02SH05 TaxID=2920696 RepID=A0AAU6TG00_UNCXX|nr:SecY-interacting protein [Vibrio metschnikovii]EKO3676092.1 SecY-interacting protein [Vibrio metschnikovii]EKO3718223.1 SecY-interacting protein [Vibrio metschnikovii]EKO3734043.1 SecY-interacting protein [Vibrio metschnikovii]EKO3744213.1 SecY-interacting protein [Vibrio metschnikovii]
MAHLVAAALRDFSQRYLQAYQQRHHHLPSSDELSHMPSPCIEQQSNNSVYWQPVEREHSADLQAVEQGIELSLHSDIAPFYGSQYSGDLPATWRGHSLTLLQVWSDDDYLRLQENILGHLVMQRRLKQKPTIFIATTDDEMAVVSICNLTGNVIREMLGTDEREVLCADVADFLNQLEPAV